MSLRAAAASGRSCARSCASTGVTGRSSSRWRSSRPIFLLQPLDRGLPRARATRRLACPTSTCCCTCSAFRCSRPGTLAAYAIAGRAAAGHARAGTHDADPAARSSSSARCSRCSRRRSSIAYVVFAAFLALVALFAEPGGRVRAAAGPRHRRPDRVHAAPRGLGELGRASRSRPARATSASPQQLSLLGNLPLVLADVAHRLQRDRAVAAALAIGLGGRPAGRRPRRVAVRDAAGRSRAARDGRLIGAAIGRRTATSALDDRPRRCRLSPHSTPEGGDGAAVQFGFTLKPENSIERTLALTRQAEAAGFEYGWLFDSHVLWRDPYPLLTLMAGATTTMRLGTCVTNPATREPSVTASTLALLDEISGGRMDLGIGRGDSARRVLGKPPTTMAHARGGDPGHPGAGGGRVDRVRGHGPPFAVDAPVGRCRSGSPVTARWPSP